MTYAGGRRIALLLVGVGAGLLLVSGQLVWTTVPGRLTPFERDVDLPGSVLFEIGRLYGLVALLLLGVLLRWRDGRQRVAAVGVAVLGVLAFSQALDVAVNPARAVRQSDDGLQRLGLDTLQGRADVQAFEKLDLPTTVWPWASVLGTVLIGAGGALVVAKARRWDDGAAAEGPSPGWWTQR